MDHEIHKVMRFEKVGRYRLQVTFDDGTTQTIHFEPILRGELFGPLRDPVLFDQVQIDPEVHTLVWPNGADFDPATLYDWPRQGPLMAKMAQGWE